MTRKHADPLYKRNARIRRAQVASLRRQGEDVWCGRCGRAIHPEQRFDVGHIDEHAGHALDNLRIEHVRCNRRHGGQLGATITNTRRQPRASEITTWSL